ncbi:MAG: hypothetical protein KAU28_03100 [Phycisphaerae bacterium]|nr:hypothetical protein [Phycisphaerae bacterium]
MSRTVTELRYPAVQLRFGLGGDWTYPARALGSPNQSGSYANAKGASKNLGLYSLGLTIPDNATPLGHRLRLYKKCGFQLQSIVDLRVQFVQAQVFKGDNKADLVTEWPAQWHVVEYPAGGGPDLWNLTLTPAEYRAQGTTGFGVAIAITVAAGSNGHVDAVGHYCSYTMPNAWFGGWVGRRSPTKVWWGM